MNTQTDNAIGILTKALKPRQIKCNGEVTEVACAWIPSMQRKYLNAVLNALLAQQEQIQVQEKRIAMLEARSKEQVIA